MRIGIIGTRGIPNQYGGFEQFAEHFSVGMAGRGHEVSVYTSHRHPYTATSYKKVDLIKCYDPEHFLGTAGQFIYDFNCFRDSRKQIFDIILILGYTSSTIWSWLFPGKSILVTNMDGLEWTREKYNKATQYFLTYAEKWGVRHSDYLIADSKGIQDYLNSKYGVNASMIPYGADLYKAEQNNIDILNNYGVDVGEYDLMIARFEPENNIATALHAYSLQRNRKLLIIGDYAHTAFGRKTFKEFSSYSHIHFLGAEFDIIKLNVLRSNCRLYIHGHSVGGTNPSLLEAMSCNALICAHDNIFNRHVLGNDAFYFKSEHDITELLKISVDRHNYLQWISNNRNKIATEYSWSKIIDKIEEQFTKWLSIKKQPRIVALPPITAINFQVDKMNK
ncbi:MAG: DUF1972 domain-containing protein [Flavipsychrobacter sp.]